MTLCRCMFCRWRFWSQRPKLACDWCLRAIEGSTWLG